MRIVEGYGARWEASGDKFRGFLEPQMEGGHEKSKFIECFFLFLIFIF